MKKLTIVFFFLLLAFNAFSTAQIPDRIIYKDTIYSLHTNPLNEFFKKNPDKKPKPSMMSSALWRGYVATFEIINNQLILKDIEIKESASFEEMIKEDYEEKWRSVLNEVFPNQDTVKMDWYSGVLVIPYGKRKQYIHMGYASLFSNYILLEINNGELKEEKEMDGEEYQKFRKDYYEAYKKTEEYKKLMERIEQNPSLRMDEI